SADELDFAEGEPVCTPAGSAFVAFGTALFGSDWESSDIGPFKSGGAILVGAVATFALPALILGAG
ncbi:MAG TPA: hypothetical protein VKB96_03470, partial [Gammaproteobacteria bacterium]|nr:hypothetical protein [Gammaproteobacteria bacterium]